MNINKQTIRRPETVKALVLNDCNMFYRRGMFDVFTNLTTIFFPANVYHMEKGLIRYCPRLRNIYLPDNMYHVNDLFASNYDTSKITFHVKYNSLTHRSLECCGYHNYQCH